jgi:glycosyltransferase involved in cell wall biosynthesis
VLFAHGEGPARAALLAAGLAGSSARVVVVEHTHEATFRPPGTARRLATRVLYRRADLVAGVSPGVAKALEDRMPGLHDRTIVLPSPGPDTRQLKVDAETPVGHPWFDGSDRPIVIISVSNIVERKGQDVLVRALPAIRRAVGDARLLLVGRIDDREFAGRLEALAAELDVADCVCLAGYRENPLPLIARASVAALASRTEGMSIFLLEAMTCGVPVVATDCPVGPAFVLEGGSSGVLVPLDDPAALAEAVTMLVRDVSVREALIERAKRRAEMFRPAEVAARYLECVDLMAPMADPGSN